MGKKILLVILAWVVLAVVVLVLYLLREETFVKEFLDWAIKYWAILSVLGAGAVALSTWIIKHDFDRSKKKRKIVESKKEIRKSENLINTLTEMHRRLVEIQKEKALNTKIRPKEFEKAMPTLADRMGTVNITDWPKFIKNVKKRIQLNMPQPNYKHRFNFKEFAKYREKVHCKALAVAKEIKKELFESKEWTIEDGVKISEWLDGYHWGVKELRDNDSQWISLFRSISHYLKDERLREMIEKHIDFSCFYNDACLMNHYSEDFSNTSIAAMLHESLVGSPISPVKMEIALNEILSEIEIRLNNIQISNISIEKLSEIIIQLAELRSNGVAIRNEGMMLDNINKQEQWFDQVYRWKEKVIDVVRQISKVDAEMFKTLNLVPVIEFNINILSPKHEKMLREHNERINRLENLIKKYDSIYHSRTNLV